MFSLAAKNAHLFQQFIILGNQIHNVIIGICWLLTTYYEYHCLKGISFPVSNYYAWQKHQHNLTDLF